MSTSEPDPYTDRGDEAEASAFRGDGVYSGGDFAGGDAEHYDRLSTDSPDDGADTASEQSIPDRA